MRKTFIAGNWKMFKTRAEAVGFARELVKNMAGREKEEGEVAVETAVCVPFLHLESLRAIFDGTDIKVGAQNVHFEDEGAFTGEISVPMLEELNIGCCIIGHSERRTYFGEKDEDVNKKLHRILKSSMIPIVCVGETLEQREAGEEKKLIREQISVCLSELEQEDFKRTVIAYEPIWAIGTGRSASNEQAQDMCSMIRREIRAMFGSAAADSVRIQYGGSVKPENASDILNMPDIDGALVGGASLEVENFMKIVNYK